MCLGQWNQGEGAVHLKVYEPMKETYLDFQASWLMEAGSSDNTSAPCLFPHLRSGPGVHGIGIGLADSLQRVTDKVLGTQSIKFSIFNIPLGLTRSV